MIVILGYLYFGQDERLKDEPAVLRAVDRATSWLLERDCTNVLLIHGNGVRDPQRICSMVDACRSGPAYRGQPVVFNEDDHFDFESAENNMLAAVDRHASWGYFDYRMKGEGFDDGYQSPPVNWEISSVRKRGFFELLRRVTCGGYPPV